MPSRIHAAEVCDARDDDQGTEAGYIIVFVNVNLCNQWPICRRQTHLYLIVLSLSKYHPWHSCNSWLTLFISSALQNFIERTAADFINC